MDNSVTAKWQEQTQVGVAQGSTEISTLLTRLQTGLRNDQRELYAFQVECRICKLLITNLHL